MAVRGWENSEATMTARGAVHASRQLCRDAVPTLPSAAVPQGDGGKRLAVGNTDRPRRARRATPYLNCISDPPSL